MREVSRTGRPSYASAVRRSGELRAAEDEGLDAVARAHRPRDREEALSRLLAEDVLQKLVHVDPVDDAALLLRRSDDVERAPGEHVPVEGPLRRIARSEQAEAAQAERLGGVGRGFDDADERDRGEAADLVERDVRRVGREDAGGRARAREPLEGRGEVASQAREVFLLEEREQGLDVEAVDDDRGVALARPAPAECREEHPVVGDGGLGSDPADDSRDPHGPDVNAPGACRGTAAPTIPAGAARARGGRTSRRCRRPAARRA